MRPLEAQSTAFKPLPPARGNPKQPSLVLFYAYREPAWTAAEPTSPEDLHQAL